MQSSVGGSAKKRLAQPAEAAVEDRPLIDAVGGCAGGSRLCYEVIGSRSATYNRGLTVTGTGTGVRIGSQEQDIWWGASKEALGRAGKGRT